MGLGGDVYLFGGSGTFCFGTVDEIVVRERAC